MALKTKSKIKKKIKTKSKVKDKSRVKRKPKKKVVKKPKKIFTLTWVCEPLMDDSSYFTKRMFGGLAVYLKEQMQMVLMESPGDRSFKGQEFDFDIWNGIFVCTYYEYHASLKKEFPSLIDHPVLKKWQYLPMLDEDFESTALEIAESIARGDERMGV